MGPRFRGGDGAVFHFARRAGRPHYSARRRYPFLLAGLRPSMGQAKSLNSPV
jgi:hypothetical protein